MQKLQCKGVQCKVSDCNLWQVTNQFPGFLLGWQNSFMKVVGFQLLQECPLPITALLMFLRAGLAKTYWLLRLYHGLNKHILSFETHHYGGIRLQKQFMNRVILSLYSPSSPAALPSGVKINNALWWTYHYLSSSVVCYPWETRSPEGEISLKVSNSQKPRVNLIWCVV